MSLQHLSLSGNQLGASLPAAWAPGTPLHSSLRSLQMAKCGVMGNVPEGGCRAALPGLPVLLVYCTQRW
jgi:hypothetical protein